MVFFFPLHWAHLALFAAGHDFLIESEFQFDSDA